MLTKHKAKRPNFRIYKKENVLEAAKERIRWLFDEFEVVVCCVSGGKDSTVLFELSLEIAKEKERLPLPTFFIDQEAEWDSTIDMIRYWMGREGVEPLWYQGPMKLFNATSHVDDFTTCWEEGKEWVRDKEPCSIHENTFGVERMLDMFEAIPGKLYAGKNCALLTGVRTEESPRRLAGMTTHVTHKGETWGRKHKRKGSAPNHYSFSPLYDWSYPDIWKAIHEHGWRYSCLYDAQYRLGTPVLHMRVSNLHHETAIRNLFYMQEVEPELHNKLTKRIHGIDAATKFQENFYVHKLPFMFADWKEYREYLLEKLVAKDKRRYFRKVFDDHDDEFTEEPERTIFLKAHVQSILSNDWPMAMLDARRSAHSSPETRERRKRNKAIRLGQAEAETSEGGGSA